MDIKTLESFKLSDAVKFHDELNPKLWANNKLRPEVKKQLKIIAEDFLEELGISGLDVVDITVSGSNAAYTYTPHSDLDLHLLVDMKELSNDEVYRELFQAKKTIYNDSHKIKVHGVPVELYVQDSNQPVVSMGEYSLLNDKWLKFPSKRRANFDQSITKAKYEKLLDLINLALKSKDVKRVTEILKKLKQYRQAGLDKAGEFGPENLAYKALRSQGYITKLYALRDKLHSQTLSIENMYAQEDYHPNAKPRGPEFKPTMPKGTVRVDVSDVYDWYKLGQHISNMKGLGKHDFGKGPPSAILSFGDENTEHKYIKDLMRTGLSTTDIDPAGHKKIKGQKVDPTFNVNEETGKKSAIYSTDVYGMTAYHSKCLEPGCDWESKRYDSIKLAQNAAQKHAQKHFKKGVAEEIVDEYRVIDRYDPTHYIRMGEKRKIHLDPVKTPINHLFNVRYEDEGDEYNYWFYDKQTDKCVGFFTIEVIDPSEFAGLKKLLQPGVKAVTPHMGLAKEVQRQGVSTLAYTTFLNGGKWVFVTDEHTKGASKLWDSLINNNVISFYVSDETGKPIEEPFSYHDYRVLGPKDRFNMVKEEVAEAFDQPYKLKWEKGDHGDVDAYTQLPDGNYLSIMFNKEYNQDNEEAWSVEFYRNNSQEVTGEGDAQRVFATVLGAIQTFIKKYKPNRIIFSASKEVEPGQNAQSRANLYDRLVQRYAKSWGFKAFRADTGNKVIYELSRIKKEVEESASGYIPSNAEKDDPRFKTALTVDIRPDTMKKDAKKFGNKISRAGIPPTLNPSGKF